MKVIRRPEGLIELVNVGLPRSPEAVGAEPNGTSAVIGLNRGGGFVLLVERGGDAIRGGLRHSSYGAPRVSAASVDGVPVFSIAGFHEDGVRAAYYILPGPTVEQMKARLEQLARAAADSPASVAFGGGR